MRIRRAREAFREALPVPMALAIPLEAAGLPWAALARPPTGWSGGGRIR